MAYKGKTTCRILKDIRRQIAEANDIDLVIKECTYQGDCAGTCPRCEAEVAYLERELARKKAIGKAIKTTGLAAVTLATAACGGIEEPPFMGDPVFPIDTIASENDTISFTTETSGVDSTYIDDDFDLPLEGDPAVDIDDIAPFPERK